MSDKRKKAAATLESDTHFQLPHSWSQLQGHEKQKQWFQTALRHNRLGSTFLLVGKEGIGKRTLARLLAKSLFCQRTTGHELNFCGSCEACIQVEASTHPDLIEIGKPADKESIPVELLIGPPEARMSEGLCHDIRLKAYYGGRKVAILDDADTLHEEASNCLLKTLEEPPPGSVLILIGTSEQRQLPTIRSRSQVVRFRELEVPQVAAVLGRILPNMEEKEIAELASCSGGSISQALLLRDPELRQFRIQLYQRLASRPMNFVELAKAVGSLADSVGKEAAALKRERLRIVFDFGEQFFRQLLVALEGQSLGADELLARLSHAAAREFRGGRAGALACWQRCLSASEEVDRFINQTTLIEAWAADLARLAKA